MRRGGKIILIASSVICLSAVGFSGYQTVTAFDHGIKIMKKTEKVTPVYTTMTDTDPKSLKAKKDFKELYPKIFKNGDLVKKHQFVLAKVIHRLTDDVNNVRESDRAPYTKKLGELISINNVQQDYLSAFSHSGKSGKYLSAKRSSSVVVESALDVFKNDTLVYDGLTQYVKAYGSTDGVKRLEDSIVKLSNDATTANNLMVKGLKIYDVSRQPVVVSSSATVKDGEEMAKGFSELKYDWSMLTYLQDFVAQSDKWFTNNDLILAAKNALTTRETDQSQLTGLTSKLAGLKTSLKSAQADAAARVKKQQEEAAAAAKKEAEEASAAASSSSAAAASSSSAAAASSSSAAASSSSSSEKVPSDEQQTYNSSSSSSSTNSSSSSSSKASSSSSSASTASSSSSVVKTNGNK